MNDQARPAIARGQFGHHIAKQGAGHRALAIDYQHLAQTRLAHGVAHQGNVFVDAQGADRPGEGPSQAIALKQHSAGLRVFAGIAQVSGFGNGFHVSVHAHIGVFDQLGPRRAVFGNEGRKRLGGAANDFTAL